MAFLELYHTFVDMDKDDTMTLEFTMEESIVLGFHTKDWPDSDLDHTKVDKFLAGLAGMTTDEYFKDAV